MKNDYHQYFISHGRHVGDYEGMYRSCADPWRIEELGLRLDMRAALLLVESVLGTSRRILDAGCGAGLLSAEIATLLESCRISDARAGSSNTPAAQERFDKFELTLSDISPTAVELCRKRLNAPGSPVLSRVSLSFIPFDLRRLGEDICPFPDRSFDLIIIHQVLWGLIENLENLFPALKKKLSPSGSLVIGQHFPEAGEKQYALHVDPDYVLKLASRASFNLTRTLETDRGRNYHWSALWSCV
jgi:SAM-dependent methyltransferase